MNEQLFQYIDGTCPHCHKPVIIIESLMYEYGLDKGGFPDIVFSEETKVAAYCLNCSTPLYAVPNIDGGYSIYPIDGRPDPKQMCYTSILSNRINSKENPFFHNTNKPEVFRGYGDDMNHIDDLESDEIPF